MKADNPYVGPRSFLTGEKLFGRVGETAQLDDVLVAERIVLMSSPSGAGKSSLINAVLVPVMRSQGFEVFPPMRVSRSLPPDVAMPPGANRFVVSLLLSLEEAQVADKRLPLDRLLTMTFLDYLEHREQTDSQSDSDLFIFDQFEEILTIDAGRGAMKAEFFDQVGAALRDKARWGLFAMREEFVAALQPYVRSLPGRLTTHFRLDKLSKAAAIDAVVEPARAAGVTFELDAAKDLVEFMSLVNVQKPDGTMTSESGDYVEPVHLQVTCRRLWDTLPDGQTTITAEYIRKVGHLDRALVDYYEDLVRAAARVPGVSERAVREWVGTKLITESGIRSEVIQMPKVTAGLDNAAIEVLVQGYLVRPEQRRGATWFELAHDRLIDAVRTSNAEWLSANLSMLQRQAATWQDQSRPAGLLLRGEALADAERWAAENTASLLPVERDFLTACRDARAELDRRRHRNIGLVIAGLAVMLMMAVGISLLLVAQQREEEADRALNDLITENLVRWGWQPEAARAATREEVQEAVQADAAFAQGFKSLGRVEGVEVVGQLRQRSRDYKLQDAFSILGLDGFAGESVTDTHARVEYDPGGDPLLAKIVAYALIRAGVRVTAIAPQRSATTPPSIQYFPDPTLGAGTTPQGMSVAEISQLPTTFELLPADDVQAVLKEVPGLGAKLGAVTARDLTWLVEFQRFEHGRMVWLPWDPDQVYVMSEGAGQEWTAYNEPDGPVGPDEKPHALLPGASAFLRRWSALKSTIGEPLQLEQRPEVLFQHFEHGTVIVAKPDPAAVKANKKKPAPFLPFVDGRVLVLLKGTSGQAGTWLTAGR